MYLILRRNKTCNKSKYELKCENRAIILMITDGEKWHYIAQKNCVHYLQE